MKNMFGRLFVLQIGLLFSCLLPLPTLAQSIDRIAIFGDSLVDDGNTFKATGGFPPSPPYFEGRFSNGRVWVESFATDLKLPATAINNFSMGGATSGSLNLIDPTLAGLTTQIDRFLLASPILNPQQLVVIWAGGNDYLFGGVSNPAIVVDNLSTATQRLIDAGARRIVVLNLPDLGKTPVGATNLARSNALTQLSTTHNLQLKASLQTLSQKNPNSSIVPIDIAALFQNAIAHPARFGLTNVTQPCFNLNTGAACATPDTYLFWDPIHPTAAGHRLIAAYAVDIFTTAKSIDLATICSSGGVPYRHPQQITSGRLRQIEN